MSDISLCLQSRIVEFEEENITSAARVTDVNFTKMSKVMFTCMFYVWGELLNAECSCLYVSYSVSDKSSCLYVSYNVSDRSSCLYVSYRVFGKSSCFYVSYSVSGKSSCLYVSYHVFGKSSYLYVSYSVSGKSSGNNGWHQSFLESGDEKQRKWKMALNITWEWTHGLYLHSSSI